MNVKLSYEELQIMLQCIQQLNFSGQNVRDVGLLVDKLQKTVKKIENGRLVKADQVGK